MTPEEDRQNLSVLPPRLRLSVRRLEELEFDPIEKLVLLHKRLEAEDNYWCQAREGLIMTVNHKGDEVPLRYSSAMHAVVLNQLNKVSADLLRYGYARVPENNTLELTEKPPLVIGLTYEAEEDD